MIAITTKSSMSVNADLFEFFMMEFIRCPAPSGGVRQSKTIVFPQAKTCDRASSPCSTGYSALYKNVHQLTIADR